MVAKKPIGLPQPTVVCVKMVINVHVYISLCVIAVQYSRPTVTIIFGQPLQVTVRPMPYGNAIVLRQRYRVCLSVCSVGVLWPNGWVDQGATWYCDRPRRRRHCVRWLSSSPTKRGTAAPHISARVYRSQTVAQLSNC